MSDLKVTGIITKVLELEKGTSKAGKDWQKQRFILARALLREKQYIFADEPTSAMNKSLSEVIIKNITEYTREKKKSLILVSHEKVLTKYFDKILDLESV